MELIFGRWLIYRSRSLYYVSTSMPVGLQDSCIRTCWTFAKNVQRNFGSHYVGTHDWLPPNIFFGVEIMFSCTLISLPQSIAIMLLWKSHVRYLSCCANCWYHGSTVQGYSIVEDILLHIVHPTSGPYHAYSEVGPTYGTVRMYYVQVRKWTFSYNRVPTLT